MTGPDRTDAPGLWARAAHTLHKRSLRGLKRLIRPLWMRRLEARNLDPAAPLLGDGPVVSLTTYEPRWPAVHYTLESIAAGRLRPSRLVLWVAPSVQQQLGLPDALRRLVARGLEIRECEDLGPHKKYFPLVMQGPLTCDMVTADDDVLYGRNWLFELAQAARARPDCVHAHRAHVMSFDAEGRFLPYARWPGCQTTRPSALHFSTGVGGVLFPPAMQAALQAAGDGFRQCCPRADDIWLNAVAARAGFQVAQVHRFSPLLFEVPGTRAHGLARENVQSGGNDRQLQQTYGDVERARLWALARGAS
ncbi:MAG: hypothetical protein L6Q75_01005 [Burkholderiaceae bacterium]|nr:hypothetical protein [Burkholderiaceae bacterium]